MFLTLGLARCRDCIRRQHDDTIEYMNSSLEIIEVGPRDGLQNEKDLFSTAQKVELIRRSLASGIRRIEVASFVHPKVVPQMADAEAVCQQLSAERGTTYVGLVLNERGLERAIATGKINEVGCVAVATDGFGMANQNMTAAESIAVCQRIIRRARESGIRAQVTISVAFGCPFDGDVNIADVADMARQLAVAEPSEIALADTIGVASPRQVKRTLRAVRHNLGVDIPLRVHFHNTRNTGIANAYAAIEEDVSRLDASVGGIGGCPFAPKATGNIATEDLIFMLERSGIRVAPDLDDTIETALWLEQQLGRSVPGMVSKAGSFP